MADTGTKVEGLNELIYLLGSFGRGALPALDDASAIAAGIVLRAAKRNLESHVGPKEPHLKDNLILKRTKLESGKYVTYSKITFRPRFAYGVKLELGHDVQSGSNTWGRGSVPAYPFLRPAADASRGQVEKLLVDQMTRELERLGGTT